MTEKLEYEKCFDKNTSLRPAIHLAYKIQVFNNELKKN